MTRRLTLKEVNEQYGGKLPADAILRPDDDEPAPLPPPPKAAGATPSDRRPAKGKRPGGRGQRFAVLNAFVDLTICKLTGAELRTWLVLFRDARGDTGTARTGQTDIGRRAGLNTRTVRRALETLEAKGMIRVIRRGKLNAGPSVYSIHPTGA